MTQTQSPPRRAAQVEVFRTGTFRPLSGPAVTYSAADLRAIADAYDPATAPAPIVVGHPAVDAPAFGWIEKLAYDQQSDRLIADLGEIEPAFASAVQAGRYKKVSMAFFKPDHPANPVPGTWYPKHIGFLGGTPPAVSGLKNVAFSADASASVEFAVEFGSATADAAAGLFSALRDFFIDQFGLEKADAALPSWNIKWLAETGESDTERLAYAAAPTPSQTPEPQVSQTPAPAATPPANPTGKAPAEREAAFAAREAALAKREADLAHADNLAFADTLVADGRLIPTARDQLVGVLDALRGTDQTVSFAGAEPVDLGEALRKVFEAQPKIVSFGAIDDPGAPTVSAATAEFASDGRMVDAGRLALHRKALDYQRQHPGTDYIAAVRAVS